MGGGGGGGEGGRTRISALLSRQSGTLQTGVCVQATVRVATNLQESGLGKIKETVDLDV